MSEYLLACENDFISRASETKPFSSSMVSGEIPEQVSDSYFDQSETEEDSFHNSTIFVVCGKCKTFMDVKDGQGVSGTSHGLCDSCLEEYRKKI